MNSFEINLFLHQRTGHPEVIKLLLRRLGIKNQTGNLERRANKTEFVKNLKG